MTFNTFMNGAMKVGKMLSAAATAINLAGYCTGFTKRHQQEVLEGTCEKIWKRHHGFEDSKPEPEIIEVESRRVE
jgi:hypothetical protein